jgi:hypothetical protein
VADDAHQRPFYSSQEAVLQPVPGQVIGHPDDENTLLMGNSSRILDPGVESGFRHLELEFS